MFFFSKRKPIPTIVKNDVFARDKSCVKCGSFENLEFDHIIPCELNGAMFDPINLQLLCHKCHAVKTGEDIHAIYLSKKWDHEMIHLEFYNPVEYERLKSLGPLKTIPELSRYQEILEKQLALALTKKINGSLKMPIIEYCRFCEKETAHELSLTFKGHTVCLVCRFVSEKETRSHRLIEAYLREKQEARP